MIAEEYAKALFGLSANDKLKDIDDDLHIICQALDENPDAIKVLTYPNISINNKKELINNITKNVDELLKRFLYVLVDNDRFGYLNEISEEFHKMVTYKSDIALVEVTSMKKLNEDQLEQLTNLLKKRLNVKNIKINNIVDEKIIGGIKCVHDGQIIDLSIKNKLETLKSSL